MGWVSQEHCSSIHEARSKHNRVPQCNDIFLYVKIWSNLRIRIAVRINIAKAYALVVRFFKRSLWNTKSLLDRRPRKGVPNNGKQVFLGWCQDGSLWSRERAEGRACLVICGDLKSESSFLKGNETMDAFCSLLWGWSKWMEAKTRVTMSCLEGQEGDEKTQDHSLGWFCLNGVPLDLKRSKKIWF